jgi:hypothetical protein
MGGRPTLAAWNKASRLHPMSGIAAHRSDPLVIASRERIKKFGFPAAMNMQKLLSESSPG